MAFTLIVGMTGLMVSSVAGIKRFRWHQPSNEDPNWRLPLVTAGYPWYRVQFPGYCLQSAGQMTRGVNMTETSDP